MDRTSPSRLGIIKQHLLPNRPGTNATSGGQIAAANDVPSMRYTLDNGVLSKEQRAFYEKNGFLVIKKLVESHDLDIYRKRFEDICSKKVDRGVMTVMRDVAISKSEFVPGENAVTKVQNFQDDPVLFEYCRHPEVVRYTRAFLGDDVMSMHTMLINKPPDPSTKSSRHPMHQDLYYFPFRPVDRIVCSWTAMQKVDRQNGCLVVLPGTHKGELLEHGYPQWEGGVNKMYHGIVDFDSVRRDRVHLDMEAGDTVFFHPLLIHGSGMNRTDGFRKSISSHFASVGCQYIDVTGTVQEAAERELIDTYVKRGNLPAKVTDEDGKERNIMMKDVWMYKSRHVAGSEIPSESQTSLVATQTN